MTQQVNKTIVLQDIAEKLRNKYGKEPGIFPEQGKVTLENAAEYNAPIINEEIKELVIEEIKKFSLGEHDLASTINNGNILIGFSNN